jgi:hypothetical protein
LSATFQKAAFQGLELTATRALFGSRNKLDHGLLLMPVHPVTAIHEQLQNYLLKAQRSALARR